ncbi:MAG: TRAP transporter small permease [Acidobacteria bacterium]|nr:TRAP transporter small permease [Acidobacteriota bacterium]
MRIEESRVAAAVGRISGVLLAASGVMILMMALAATYGVARRYLFRSPEPYSYEISMMLLLWCFVLSVAAVQRQQRHLRGDFILNRMPRSIRFFVNALLSPLLALLSSAVLAWKGWEAAMFSLRIGERSNSAWSEPLFPVKALIPAGYGILFLVALIQFFQGIRALAGKPAGRGES